MHECSIWSMLAVFVGCAMRTGRTWHRAETALLRENRFSKN